MIFDLNIYNYSRNELIDMFELPINFDKKILEEQSKKLITNILKDISLNEEVKECIIDFLNNVKNIILDPSSIKLTTQNIVEQNNHIVQKQKSIPYAASFQNEYFLGTINPLKKRTIIQNINIDSRFRDNFNLSSSSNFNITLPFKLNNVVQMQLMTFELPNVYYIISSQYNNNFFTLIINNIKTTITIPYGNYNIVTIMDAINTVISSIGAPFSFVSFIANPITLKTIIEPNGSGVITSLELVFYEGITDSSGNVCAPYLEQLSLGWLLGFRLPFYKDDINYISEGVIDLSGTKYFYLVVDDFNNNVNDNFIGAYKKSILNKNILARISKDVFGSNKVLFLSDFGLIAEPREYFGPVNIKTLGIQLLDEYGRVVDLNSMDFNFCVSLITIYDL